jgi:hypothetical protein
VNPRTGGTNEKNSAKIFRSNSLDQQTNADARSIADSHHRAWRGDYASMGWGSDVVFIPLAGGAVLALIRSRYLLIPFMQDLDRVPDRRQKNPRAKQARLRGPLMGLKTLGGQTKMYSSFPSVRINESPQLKQI